MENNVSVRAKKSTKHITTRPTKNITSQIQTENFPITTETLKSTTEEKNHNLLVPTNPKPK